MNIKSLLLGSAAALAAVSGAQAADAIVAAEPEPMEYVRVCDAFGKGYFYIPGTETCLQIGGRIRFDVSFGNAYNRPPYRDGTRTLSRAELYVRSASDTEYGALKTEFKGRWNNRTDQFTQGNTTVATFIAANITLGGFLVGFADTQYSSFTGYAGDIISDDVVSYGRFELNQISYTFDGGNGFKAVVALEDNSDITTVGGVRVDNDDDYAPNVVAGVKYATDAFGVSVVGGYDTVLEEGGLKARLDATFGEVDLFVMGGYNPGDDTIVNPYAQWGGEWALWAGAGVQFTESLKGNVQVAYNELDTLAVAANVKFTGISGLLIQPEVNYTDFDGDDTWAGIVRFQRTF